MDHSAFRQAKQFAFQDVWREVSLAKASETKEGNAALQAAGVQSGGGNFMAALALLCYTEFAGKLKFNCKKPNGSDHASENFNRFFDELGPSYKSFRLAGNNVYDIFRCGLAHEYYVKKTCTIAMFGRAAQPGIGKCSDGRYYFVVERYCQDMERAFDALEDYLFPAQPAK
jgi:hypothetical protein